MSKGCARISLTRAEIMYKAKNGRNEYNIFVHKGSSRYPSFKVHVPCEFLAWDSLGGVMAFPNTEEPYALCRCGIVEHTIFFCLSHPFNQNSTISSRQIKIGLKLMTKTQLRLQRDDVEHELRIMHALQPSGLDQELKNRHVLRWECASDQYNEYIATELAANGSLVLYAPLKVREIRQRAKNAYLKDNRAFKNKSNEEILDMARASIGKTWMIQGLIIFEQVINALCYLHQQNVAHLDLDPCNIVMDSAANVRIIDFGSSQVMDATGKAGTGAALIKFKPLFVPPEVVLNNRCRVPRPGFDGRAADMYSAGTLLYQLLFWGHPAGDLVLTHDAKWRYNVRNHAAGNHKDCVKSGRECYLCYRKIEIPAFLNKVIVSLLSATPERRMSAEQVASIMKGPMKQVRAIRRALVPPEMNPFDKDFLP